VTDSDVLNISLNTRNLVN